MSKQRKIMIPRNVKEFASAKWKKFKKEEGEYSSSKKELQEMWYTYLLEFMPDVIEFLTRFGHIKTEDIQTIKASCYQKITDPKFVKFLKKQLKSGDKIRSINLLPILLREIITETQKENAARLEAYEEAKKEDPSTKEPEYFVIDFLTDLSLEILGKRIKKLTKHGISKELAYDVLSIIPCKDALKAHQFYRLSQFIQTLYIHADKSELPINFSDIVEKVFGEEYYQLIITFSLLERKEKFTKLSETQKSLWLNISSWCFDTMENMKKEDIENILISYIKNRKRDASAGKDGNRRYNISALPSEDYPRINKVINNKIDSSLKEYL